jgi:anti-anti-sigma regulatory factor
VIAERELELPVSLDEKSAVVLAGDYLNKISGETIERECRRKLDDGCKRLVVDFSQTDMVNSIGVSILLGVIDSAANSGARVEFLKVKGDTIELFEMLGITDHVTLV